MNRTLKRPMFRIGGSAGTGITSGLDQPRKQYAEGTPNPYNMGNFAPGTGAGFLTQFGLDLLSRPPQGNILQTAAVSAKEPFKDYQAAQFRMGEKRGERDFLRGEREAGQEFKAGESQLNRDTQLEIAGMRDTKSDALYNTMLEKYITDGMQPQAAERAAINAPVQGTAADIMKIAMINMHQGLKKAKLEAKMTLQVHDELIIESPTDETKEVVDLLKKSMSEATKLKVPLEVDVGIGNNWDQAH